MIDLIVSFVLTWIFAAILLIVVDRLNIGLSVGSFSKAMIAALVIAIVNLLLGTLLRIIAWPIDILCCGMLSWLINWIIAAIVLWVSDKFVKGFEIANFVAAIVSALVLAILSGLATWIATALFG